MISTKSGLTIKLTKKRPTALKHIRSNSTVAGGVKRINNLISDAKVENKKIGNILRALENRSEIYK